MHFTNSLLALVAFLSTSSAVERTGSFMNEAGRRVKQQKLEQWNTMRSKGTLPRKSRSVMRQATECTDGFVTLDGEDFPCDNIDFLSFWSLEDANVESQDGTTMGSDMWGWLSPSGMEITLWCVDNALWFIDSTNPEDIRPLGYMDTERPKAAWCDVKVYADVAYVGRDGVDDPVDYGVQAFNLTRLEGLDADTTRRLEPDFVYNEHGSSHNVISDVESGFLYTVGGETCKGGLHMIDLAEPLEPVFAGCYDGDQYTHDAQCVVYRGPDTRFTGQQICLTFNEDTLTIVDVTNKSDVQMLSRRGYSTSRYTHQGWFTADFRYVLLDDEIDERENDDITNTTTYIVDVTDLTDPIFVDTYTHGEISIDHNLYIWGAIHQNGWAGNAAMENPPNVNYAYLSNYIAGIKVLDLTDISNIQQIGMFDIAPDLTDTVDYLGTWSNYMHPSGVLAVSSIDRGLFMLRPRMAFDEQETLSPASEPTSFPTDTFFEPIPVPDEWGCRTRYFSDFEYCDCQCGMVDPDCGLEGILQRNCGEDTVCSADGTACVTAASPSDDDTPDDETSWFLYFLPGLAFFAIVVVLSIFTMKKGKLPSQE